MDKQIDRARIVAGLLVFLLAMVVIKTAADIGAWATFALGGGQ